MTRAKNERKLSMSHQFRAAQILMWLVYRAVNTLRRRAKDGTK